MKRLFVLAYACSLTLPMLEISAQSDNESKFGNISGRLLMQKLDWHLNLG